MSLVYPYTFVNGTDAEAPEVNANFSAAKTAIDAKADKTEIIKVLEVDIYSTLSVGKCGIPMIIPESFTITEITAACGTAPTGANAIIDIHDNSDTTIYTTQANRPTITAGTKKANVTTPNVVVCTKEHVFHAYIDQVGSTIPGADLKIQIRGRMTV
jgi:hypothetical protein